MPSMMQRRTSYWLVSVNPEDRPSRQFLLNLDPDFSRVMATFGASPTDSCLSLLMVIFLPESDLPFEPRIDFSCKLFRVQLP